MWKKTAFGLTGTFLIATLAGCGNVRPVSNAEYTSTNSQDSGPSIAPTAFDSSFKMGVGKGEKPTPDETGLGVNAYLWRGTLDTLAFMPLDSADPFGGVIITDWWQPTAAPNERFKVNAYILGRVLRADGVKLSIFRQVEQDGQWSNAPVSPGTIGEIENKILARARELRSQTAQN
jgi:hypothetical protein